MRGVAIFIFAFDPDRNIGLELGPKVHGNKIFKPHCKHPSIDILYPTQSCNSSRYPPVDSAGQAAFIPPSPPRSPYTPPQQIQHLNLRGGAPSGPPTGDTTGFPDVTKRIRRRVNDVRRGGKWEDLKDGGSDLEEKPNAANNIREPARPASGHGIERSFYRILERLEQVVFFFFSDWCSLIQRSRMASTTLSNFGPISSTI